MSGTSVVFDLDDYQKRYLERVVSFDFRLGCLMHLLNVDSYLWAQAGLVSSHQFSTAMSAQKYSRRAAGRRAARRRAEKLNSTPPGTPSSRGQVSDCDGYTEPAPQGLVWLQLGFGDHIRKGDGRNVFELIVDATTSVGWLVHQAAEQLRKKGGLPPGGFDIVYNTKILEQQEVKVYDVVDCWSEGIAPPIFLVVSKHIPASTSHCHAGRAPDPC